MKKLLYLFTILLVLTSCSSHRLIEQTTSYSDSTINQSNIKTEVGRMNNSSSYTASKIDSSETTLMQELLTVEFDSSGKPKSLTKKKKILLKSSTTKKRLVKENHEASQIAKKDSAFVAADIQHNQYRKVAEKKDKYKNNTLYYVVLSLLTLIICHLVLKHKIKQKKLGA